LRFVNSRGIIYIIYLNLRTILLFYFPSRLTLFVDHSIIEQGNQKQNVRDFMVFWTQGVPDYEASQQIKNGSELY